MPHSLSLLSILQFMTKYHASDAFLSVGSPITLKIQGEYLSLSNEKITPSQSLGLLQGLLPEPEINSLLHTGDLNTSYMLNLPSLPNQPPQGGVFRISSFKQRSSFNTVIRYVPQSIPTLSELHLPSHLADLGLLKRGLVLVVGSTGSGKSTTLASIIHHRNTTTPGHILTIEEPIEYLHRNHTSLISQREIGRDCDSLQTALKHAMRQAPDCLLIGEIRDRETLDSAISYAMSGHLVLSTLHANNSVHALSRIASFYPPETRPQLLHDLSSSLRAILSQRLLKTPHGSRIPAIELLRSSSNLSLAIQKGDWADVRHSLETSNFSGSSTFEQSISSLIHKGLINREEGLAHSDSPTNLLWLLNNAPTPPSSGKPPASAALSVSHPLPTTSSDTPFPQLNLSDSTEIKSFNIPLSGSGHRAQPRSTPSL